MDPIYLSSFSSCLWRVLFGAKKLPDLARSMGQSINEFRKAREEINES